LSSKHFLKKNGWLFGIFLEFLASIVLIGEWGELQFYFRYPCINKNFGGLGSF